MSATTTTNTKTLVLPAGAPAGTRHKAVLDYATSAYALVAVDADTASTNYWIDGFGRLWQDEPIITGNTYYGHRHSRRQVKAHTMVVWV